MQTGKAEWPENKAGYFSISATGVGSCGEPEVRQAPRRGDPNKIRTGLVVTARGYQTIRPQPPEFSRWADISVRW